MNQKNLVVILIVGLVVGIVAGYGISFSINQSQISQLNADISAKDVELADLKENLLEKDKELTKLGWIAGPPPESLDNLYPPKAPGPIFLGAMFEIAGPFGGIIVDLMEEDFENVIANYDLFKEKYLEVSKLVPEWEDQYDMSKVEALGEALKSGDQGGIQGALGEIGMECGSCHQKYMTAVQYKYHWPSFEEVTLQDPVTLQEMSFHDYMMSWDLSYVGVSTDLGEGQVDRAIDHFDDFKSRFIGVREACSNCHGISEAQTGKKQGELAFVSIDNEQLLLAMEDALKSTPPNVESVFEMTQAIGAETCLKCHWVHIPSALAQERWEHME